MTDITVNGNTYNDGAYDAVTNPKGQGNGGHRVNLIPMLVDLMADATRAVRATSTTSLSIGTGEKVFTLATEVTFAIGAVVKATNPADVDEWMLGTVTAQSGTLLTVDVSEKDGSGTVASWDIQITGKPGAAGATSFLGLSDTPSAFASQTLKLLRVNAGETALEFTAPFNPAIPGAIGGTTPAAGAFSTLSATGLITATGGQIAFPATQVPSAGANVLDDYEEGTWTPAFTFATPGDLSVVYGSQIGRYTKVGNLCFCAFQVTLSTFTHSSASGNASITGLPFTVSGAINFIGGLRWSGITKANFTNVVVQPAGGTTTMAFIACGSGQTSIAIATGDMPTGGTPLLWGTAAYLI